MEMEFQLDGIHANIAEMMDEDELKPILQQKLQPQFEQVLYELFQQSKY
jgi:hypothetical protein